MNYPGAATCDLPLCRSYLSRKAKCVGLKTTKQVPNKDYFDVIKINDLVPGDRVSTDQYKCRIKEKLPYTRGKKDPHNIYGKFIYGS